MWRVYLAIGILFISSFGYVLSWHKGNEIEKLERELTECNQKKETCNERVETHNRQLSKAGETIEKIRTVVQRVESPCNCARSAVDSSIIDWVRGTKK